MSERPDARTGTEALSLHNGAFMFKERRAWNTVCGLHRTALEHSGDSAQVRQVSFDYMWVSMNYVDGAGSKRSNNAARRSPISGTNRSLLRTARFPRSSDL